MKYEQTYCSQCGGEFGPGDHGFSACSDHSQGNEFKTMNQLVDQFFSLSAFQRAPLAYCDYIAHLISKNLKAVDTTSEKLLSSVSRPQYDLTETGAFRSTTKTIEVEDRFGTKYRVTVEQVKEKNT